MGSENEGEMQPMRGGVAHYGMRGWPRKGGGSLAKSDRTSPPGATLSDSARRKPSEIPSQTRSVSAFLPGRVSTGPRSFGEGAMLLARH